MALGVDYARQDCSLARALEVVGERWTLLILRDCFLGVRRFSDFAGPPRHLQGGAAQRLDALVDGGPADAHRRPATRSTTSPTRRTGLWPALFALAQWGDAAYAPHGAPRRLFEHAGCGARVGPDGRCPTCGPSPAPATSRSRPGPGADPTVRDDAVSLALRTPHRLLEPVAVRAAQRPE